MADTASRAGRPPVPDAQIIDGARRALIANRRASMADIAKAGGVGKSALYARFPSRERLLQHFSNEANQRYDDAMMRALRLLHEGTEPTSVLREYITEIALADVHPILAAVSGTFERSPDDLAESIRLQDVGKELVDRWHEAGVLRPSVTLMDLLKVDEMLSAVTGGSPDSTRQLRVRMVDLVIPGLTTGTGDVVGSPATPTDFQENRRIEEP